ncbi:hypothetical protein K2173_003126 [Erythroxylum novogranatense]|uniref:FBD domain-containing protein n=1 Tax=Erythroxylum novogranatense TaxID=1862640 RepID=A0AAV8TBE4_9ROSI|nr:hypothetical protein K2173_003126 [Erythroxylum novogranatense]
MDMDNNVDMFRTLSDPLLIIILSFLPFHEAVRTCVLSKRWSHLWRETTNLDFNENFFVKRGANEAEEVEKLQRNGFISFVRQFIVNYPQKGIQRFNLACSKPNDFPEDMQNFFSFSISRNVREFGLDFSCPTWREHALDNHDPVFELPLHFYEYKNLKSLTLFSCSFDMHKFANFNVLKRLSLGWIQLSVDSIKVLLKSCPILETLSLKKCWKMEHFEICLPNSNLKELVLEKCEFVQHWFLFDGPNFRVFKYSGKVGYFHMENQSDMVEADLDFSAETEFGEVGTLLYDLLQELYAVQVLTVCSVFLQLIPSGEEPFGLQSPLNVRHLNLKSALHPNEYWGIKFMLKSCPLLEKLTIHIGPANIFSDYEPPYDFNPRDFWSKYLIVESCITRTLKVVEVKGFKGTRNELYVIAYMIQLGQVMEQLKIYIVNDGEITTEYIQRAQVLLQLRKASENLRISFC